MSIAPVAAMTSVVADSSVPVLLMVAPAPANESVTSCAETVPALLNVPPPFASMPLPCLLMMLAPASLLNVTVPEM